MAMRVSVDDTGMDLSVTVHASGGYAPDVMNDLSNRALAIYKDGLASRLDIMRRFGDETETADVEDL